MATATCRRVHVVHCLKQGGGPLWTPSLTGGFWQRDLGGGQVVVRPKVEARTAEWRQGCIQKAWLAGGDAKVGAEKGV